jgi:O-antigen/teichoic acid export membrane protein
MAPPTLRSNVVLSTIAMLLVGLTRPVFNMVVTRAFGLEVNGRAASIVALIFLASLPATAALPTVMVRHLSRALGKNDHAEAAGHAALAIRATLVLAIVGIAGALLRVWTDAHTDWTHVEDAFLIAGILAYSYWRLFRTLLLAIGQAMKSVIADLLSLGVLGIVLLAIALADRPGLVVGAFVAVYVSYIVLTGKSAISFSRGGKVGQDGKSAFIEYNVLWFMGSASSLAAREICLLLVDARAEKAIVGELSVALSVLSMLAFAPRIIELPLVHELSLLGGQGDRRQQVEITNRAMDWLEIVTLAGSFGAALLAPWILAITGKVETPVIVVSFIVIAFALSAEMVVTPVANLLVTEARPLLQAVIGTSSLLLAFAWWFSPWCEAPLGVVIGLAISHAAKAIGSAWYGRTYYGVKLLPDPVRKIIAIALGAALLALVQADTALQWPAFLIFEVALFVLFAKPLKAMFHAAAHRTPA